MKLENVVYDDQIQVIKSPKKFSNDFKIIGDMKVELINGFEVSKLYEQAVLHDEDTNFKKTVVIFVYGVGNKSLYYTGILAHF